MLILFFCFKYIKIQWFFKPSNVYILLMFATLLCEMTLRQLRGAFMNRCMASKRILSILLGLLLLIILSLFGGYQIVQSATAPDNYPTSQYNDDYIKALNKAPKGLHWKDDDFILADFSKAAQYRREYPTLPSGYINQDSLFRHQPNNYTGHTDMTNYAKIAHSTNPASLNTSIIQMTNDTYQTGAVWSNSQKDNYFDISHEQVASMWLYFGQTSNAGGNNASKYGDGMAFVLQNDDTGENAIALSATGIPVNGQSLGVWGADWNPANTNSQILADTAIQNSWALEFDTFPNISTNFSDITGEGVSFDSKESEQIGRNHIAGNYPGQSSTYKDAGSGDIHYFEMSHYNIKQNLRLVDSEWHHVTIKWTPNEDDSNLGTLTYLYNDKNPVTGVPIDNPIKSTFTIDTNKFYATGNAKKLSSTKRSTKLHWGFTASTGVLSENNLLIFESIPSFVDAEATSHIYDDSQGGNEIIKTEPSTIVDPNSEIRYTYNLKYKGWTKKWNGIHALINVPNNVSFTSGTVTYPDSPNDKGPRPIKENFNSSKLDIPLPEGLNEDSRNAVIELKGKTSNNNNTSQTLNVPSAHASFDGDNLITDTDTVPFRIGGKLLALDSSSTNPITLDLNEDANIPGHVYYANNDYQPDYENMIVYTSLNGEEYAPTDKLVNSNGDFVLNIPNKDLRDSNTVSFYVKDSQNNSSNTVERKINVGKALSFGKIQTDFFQTINATNNSQIIPRKNKWSIPVIDNRKKGSPWTVEASNPGGLEIKNTGTKLKGHLIYKDPKNNIFPIKDANVKIDQHIKDKDGETTTDIPGQWKPNNGILLAIDPHNTKGTYSGTINWTLYDTLSNT